MPSMCSVPSYSQILQKLSRVTQSTSVIPEIDGLRFLAIMPVVLLHLCTNYLRTSTVFSEADVQDGLFFKIINTGGIGVNVFFAISGFVLALPFVSHYLNRGKKVELEKYYFRRLTRLEPPFVISMLLFFCAWLMMNKYSLLQLLDSLWASLLYVHYFVFGKWSLINPISWSLETEVQFYILAPFVFTLFLIRKVILRFGLLVITSISLAALVFYQKQTLLDLHLAKSIVVYFPFFATGIMLCDIYVRKRHLFNTRSYFWDIAGIAGVLLIYSFHYYAAWYSILVQCGGILLIFTAAFKGRILNAFFTRREIVVIGGMCYSIYLLHYGLLYVLMFFTGNFYLHESFALSYLLQVVIIVPLIILTSSVFFIFFEKPFMYKNWYRNFPGGYFNSLFK